MSFFSVNILTPYGIICEGAKADSLLVPAESGQLNILPEHTHVIFSLGIGELCINPQDGNSKSFFVGKGICKIIGKKVLVLANSASSPEKLDRKKCEEELAKAKASIKDGHTPTKDLFSKEFEKIQMAEQKLHLIKKFNR